MQNLKVVDYTKKRLDDMFLVVYAIKNDINIKKGDIIENIDIYTFIGINKRGISQLVGIYQDRPLNNRYWLDIFENFKTRGLDTISFFILTYTENSFFNHLVISVDTTDSEKIIPKISSGIIFSCVFHKPGTLIFKNLRILFIISS